MSELEKIVMHSLRYFKVSIVVEIGDKLVLVNPRILQDIPLETVANVLSASDLTDKEILQGLEIIDVARKPKRPVPTKKPD